MAVLREDQVLILAAGMPRSGSTWLYNAIRLLLLRDPRIAGNLGCGWIADWNAIPKRKYLLVKLHDYDVGAVVLSKLAFYSYRDVRDAIASQKRRFGGCPDMLWADLYIHQHELWMRQAACVMKYEDMLRDPSAVVAALLQGLEAAGLLSPTAGGPLDPVIRELDRLAEHPVPGAGAGYDPTTLYHPAHITDGRPDSWHGWLDEDLVAEITAKYRWWFDKYGYGTDADASSVYATAVGDALS